MDNVCRDCGRKFHSDLKYCPRCGGGAMPPRTKSWHYSAPGIIAHSDPDEELVEKAYRQNGWIQLCMGILLLPAWLFGLDLMMEDLSSGEPYPLLILLFVVGTALLVLVFLAASSAFQARRPGIQVMSALLVTVISSAWSPYALIAFIGMFLVAMVFWSNGGSSRHPTNPSYLLVMSGLAILSAVMAYLWFLSAPMFA
jgi:RNA polymerase subunit RPABC4/transcription elongation factor Spt4